MGEGINSLAGPPTLLVARIVQCTMMGHAEWHRPFVADLKGHRTGLGEAQVMGLAGAASADEASLCRHHAQVVAVTNAPRPVDQSYDRSLSCPRFLRA